MMMIMMMIKKRMKKEMMKKLKIVLLFTMKSIKSKRLLRKELWIMRKLI